MPLTHMLYRNLLNNPLFVSNMRYALRSKVLLVFAKEISEGKTEFNNPCRDTGCIDGIGTDQTDRRLPVIVVHTHTCAFESRGSSTITCATSSPLFHCKLLVEPRAKLYSYHNEKVVPIRRRRDARMISSCDCDSRV